MARCCRNRRSRRARGNHRLEPRGGSALARLRDGPGRTRPFNGIGYSHVAAASNACTQPVQCQLWTDVDPLPQLVELDPDEREDVLFRRGSPASELRAFSRCKFSK